MAIEGPLRELGIHDVFQLLDLSRKTGVLSIASELRRNQGTVYFDGGAVVYASIRRNPHPLGGMLVRAGKISEADLQRARDMQAAGDRRRLGEILVAIGCLTVRELDRQVRRQIEEVIFEVMNWREGYFSFVEGPLVGIPADATVRIRTESLLMEGARRIDEWSRIEHRLPHVGIVPRLSPGASEDAGTLDFLPKEWEVLATIDGELTVRDIAQSLGASEFDVAKILFGLDSAGIVVLGEPAPAAEAEAEDGEGSDLPSLLGRLDVTIADGDAAGARVALDLMRARFPQDPQVLAAAGRLSLAEGSVADAEDHFRRALRLDPAFAEAHRRLGDAVAMQGRLEEAVEWWRRWLKVGGQQEGAGATARVQLALEAAETLRAYLEERHGE